MCFILVPTLSKDCLLGNSLMISRHSRLQNIVYLHLISDSDLRQMMVIMDLNNLTS